MEAFREEELESMRSGADVIAGKWLHIRRRDRVLIATTTTHLQEAQLMKERFLLRTSHVDLLVLEEKGKNIGIYFEENVDVFRGYTIIVGACDYSLVTTKAAKRAIDTGEKFLSLPLSTNNGHSMLGFDFLHMDTKKSKLMAGVIRRYIEGASEIRVTTQRGTDLHFFKRRRTPGFFNGDIRDGKGFSSASFEIYVPIEEDASEGTLILDGSYGYIGKVESPVRILLREGRICSIEENAAGRKLAEYLAAFHDKEMTVAAELGIGLNSFSRCEGECYIEDESSYGTFHIGFGRNIALGGRHEAVSHFDLVTRAPDIYADNRRIIERGAIIAPEMQIY